MRKVSRAAMRGTQLRWRERSPGACWPPVVAASDRFAAALAQSGELFGVGPRDPGRGVPQAVALRVFADGEQDLPDRALYARQVKVAPGLVPRPGGLRFRRQWVSLGTSSWGSSWPTGLLKPKDWPLAGSDMLPLPALPSAAARASSLGESIGGRSEGRRLP